MREEEKKQRQRKGEKRVYPQQAFLVVFQQGRHRSKPGRLFTVLAVRAPPENTDVELQIKTRSSHPPKAVSSRKKQKGHFKFWVKEKNFHRSEKNNFHYS